MKEAKEYRRMAIKYWIDFDSGSIGTEEYEKQIESLFEQSQEEAYNQALEDVYGYSLILVEPVDPDDDYNVRETSYLIMIDDFKKLKK